MDDIQINEWILNNKGLIRRAIYSTRLVNGIIDFEDLLQNAYAEILDKYKYYNPKRTKVKFSTYIFEVVRNLTKRYIWKNKFPVSVSYPVADTIIPLIIKLKSGHDGTLTEEDYEYLRKKYNYAEQTIKVLESLLYGNTCPESICELLGISSRHTVVKYEDDIDYELLKENVNHQLALLPKAYQQAICNKYGLDIPDKYIESTSGINCNNKYHLENSAMRYLKKYYTNKYSNIGELIND